MWTDDQVRSLEERQDSSFIHPYTCVCGAGTLEVSKDGLYCTKCGYVQTWVHSSDLNWGWKVMNPFYDIDEDSRTI